MSEPNDNSGLPNQIGPYLILDTLGEGGMSVVYLAEQSEPVKRRVALKILKPGMDSKQIVARFESERQALAVLDHPNIAKIFDGGIAESGRPYFVMEQVKGVPITDYCDDQRLDNEERLKVFIKVCSAVQHAHLKGLIHRDLKPTNILVGVVDGEPQPKIIDFGIAKAMSTTLTDSTLFTRVGQIIGTPQYMSPEQAGVTGLDVDTRTDIYSLGVVLYELLVGTVPLDLRAIGDQAMQVALRERDPPKPSTRITELGDTKDEIAKARATSVDNLRRQLSGDLDWIVMRAIEKDRTRRYETANALAMECRRFLNHDPVIARPPSPGYLLTRFVQRNRLTVVAGSVAMLAVIGGATAAVFGYVRATEAERVAVQEATTAKKVSDFLIELFEVSDPSEARGNSITAREVLDRGSESIEQDLTDQPEVQAALMMTMGTVYENLGLYDESRRLLERGLAVRQILYGSDHPDIALSQAKLGSLLANQSELEAAENMYRQSIAIQRRGSGRKSSDLATSLVGLAEIRSLQSDAEEAEKLLREAFEIRRLVLGEENLPVAIVLDDLGMSLFDQGKFYEAEPLLRESLAMKRKVIPGGVHPSLETSLNNLAVFLVEIGELSEPAVLFRESVTIQRRLLGDLHPDLATGLNNLAFVLHDLGDFGAAEKGYQESLSIRIESLGKMHPLVGQSLNNLAYLYDDMGDNDRALETSRQALAVYREAYTGDHRDIAYGLQTLAGRLIKAGDDEAAESLIREALEMHQALFDPGHPDIAITQGLMANVLVRKGEMGAALELAQTSHESLIESYGADHWRTTQAGSKRGAILTRMSRYAEAEPLLLESYEKQRTAAVDRASSVETTRQRLVELYSAWGRPDEAERYRATLNGGGEN